MSQYALLVKPGFNRVYAQSAPALGAAELTICVPSVRDVATESIAGNDYLTFEADALDDAVAAVLGRLSVAFALFERRGDALVPVALPSPHRYDDDLLTIQRYAGKTNEAFTTLLVNVTTAGLDGPLTLLDPMAGRGTTLHQAVLYGWDATGVEIDKTHCDAYRTFLTTWLKNKRVPHKAKPEKQPFTVTFAPDRAGLDAGGQRAVMINGDCRTLDGVKHNSVDCIVSDLPYGVRHGSQRGRSERSPLALVEESLAVWQRVLRARAAIGLAFNEFTCPRADLVKLLDDAGFDVYDEGAYRGLQHRVDQSINRDVVVSRRR